MRARGIIVKYFLFHEKVPEPLFFCKSIENHMNGKAWNDYDLLFSKLAHLEACVTAFCQGHDSNYIYLLNVELYYIQNSTGK